jgi:hypothetical protein
MISGRKIDLEEIQEPQTDIQIKPKSKVITLDVQPEA